MVVAMNKPGRYGASIPGESLPGVDFPTGPDPYEVNGPEDAEEAREIARDKGPAAAMEFLNREPTDYEVRANHAAQGSSVHPFDGGQPRSPVAQRKLGPDLEDRAANRNAVIADQDAELQARQAGKPHSDSYTRSRRTFREDDLDDDGGWGDSAAAERYYYGYDPRP